MEFGEKLEETLLREVKEETALEIEPIKILTNWDLITSHNRQYMLRFKGSAFHKCGVAALCILPAR